MGIWFLVEKSLKHQELPMLLPRGQSSALPDPPRPVSVPVSLGHSRAPPSPSPEGHCRRQDALLLASSARGGHCPHSYPAGQLTASRASRPRGDQLMISPAILVCRPAAPGPRTRAGGCLHPRA